MKAKKQECMFMEKEFVLGREHVYCQSPEMRVINKIEESKKLICAGEVWCNCSQYDENIE